MGRRPICFLIVALLIPPVAFGAAEPPALIPLAALENATVVIAESGKGPRDFAIDLAAGMLIAEIETDGASLLRVSLVDDNDKPVGHVAMMNPDTRGRLIVPIRRALNDVTLRVDTGSDPQQTWRMRLLQNATAPSIDAPTGFEGFVEAYGPIDFEKNARLLVEHRGKGVPVIHLHDATGEIVKIVGDRPLAGNFKYEEVVDVRGPHWFTVMTDREFDMVTGRPGAFGIVSIRIEETDATPGGEKKKDAPQAVAVTADSVASGAVSGAGSKPATSAPKPQPKPKQPAALGDGLAQRLGAALAGMGPAAGCTLELTQAVQHQNTVVLNWTPDGTCDGAKVAAFIEKTLGAEVESQHVAGVMSVLQVEGATFEGRGYSGSGMLNAQQLMLTLQGE